MNLDAFRAMNKPKVVRAHPEEDLQIACVELLELITIKPAAFWHVPNGGFRKGREAARLKAMGVRPGVTDLHFIWAEKNYGVIELKVGRGKLTPDQELYRDDVVACGHPWAEARSVDEVLTILRHWGFPMREVYR